MARAVGTAMAVVMALRGLYGSSGLTVVDLRITIYILNLLRPAPKAQSAHEGALDLVSGLTLRNLYYVSTRIRCRGFRGPPCPRKAENLPKNQSRISVFIFPEVCPAKHLVEKTPPRTSGVGPGPRPRPC